MALLPRPDDDDLDALYLDHPDRYSGRSQPRGRPVDTDEDAPLAERISLDWVRRAACEGMPLAQFFPAPGKNPPRVCTRCPVRIECVRYVYALAEVDRIDGTFAGLSASMRKRYTLDEVLAKLEADPGWWPYASGRRALSDDL